MLTSEAIIDGKYLSLCSASEAVAWLKEKRESFGQNDFYLADTSHEENILLERNDPFIDFGLARYGRSAKIAKVVHARGDEAIRCALFAHFENGGCGRFFTGHEFGPPQTPNELTAFASNLSLSDNVLTDCFERKHMFEAISEEEYQNILIRIGDNPRLWTHYDETYLDGYSDYSYHNVFSAAWQLAVKVPNTIRWAGVVYHVLYRCLPPHNFDPLPAIARWHLEPVEEKTNITFHLRSRLADVLKADDALLKASDPALRESFYKRFDPAQYKQWPKWAAVDTEYFLEGAICNPHLWRTSELRAALSQLCWSHPDPSSNMDMPNALRGMDKKFRTEHPEWFSG